ncbi:DUF3265 domain-containing protein [Vibrio parahaemolyticus]|uniref:DUF3265 domain-containing protein n=1 Tax=Vibrio diabolicus TaxID=50719 RepID=A0AAX1XFK1_9VIBR|nr:MULTISPECIES: DUF3265 domain-containing protein [Vibrio]ADV86388.1 hypothetical protein VVMO6_01366 [Vibrio vulnificus MO6-24/O]MBO0246467.1 DUF3265 domain-containing protein [Vibrio sp. Vb0592]MDK9795158.1 DUF3265 domain-containing protein [Vibrio sp. D431a]MDK9809252.1 DUF3265 domain-containing protein [Vibrio sp. D406a]EGQ8241623.1 DUF3265 domain-containing protein [Vibrio parahaemolyticus]
MEGQSRITNNLRVIQHAWHFWHALVFGVEVPCSGLVITCFTP